MAKQDWDSEAWDRGLDLNDAVSKVDGIDYYSPEITRFTFDAVKETVEQCVSRLLRIQKMMKNIEKKRVFEQ
jgi:hypothetical protein